MLIALICLGMLVPDLMGLVGISSLLPPQYTLGICLGGDAALGARAPSKYRLSGLVMGLALSGLLRDIPTQVYPAITALAVLAHLRAIRGLSDVICNALCLAGAIVLVHSHAPLGIALLGVSMGRRLCPGQVEGVQRLEEGEVISMGLVNALAWVSPARWLLGSGRINPRPECLEAIEAFASGVTLAVGILLGAARSGPLQFASLGDYQPPALVALALGAGIIARQLPVARIPRIIGVLLGLALCIWQAPALTALFVGLGLVSAAIDPVGHHTNGVVPWIPLVGLVVR